MNLINFNFYIFDKIIKKFYINFNFHLNQNIKIIFYLNIDKKLANHSKKKKKFKFKKQIIKIFDILKYGNLNGF